LLIQIITGILTKGGSANYRSPVTLNTSLHEAIYGYQRKIIPLLLELGADQLLTDQHGNLPLHIAAKFEFVDIVRMLLNESRGSAAVFVENDAGKRPIDMARTSYLKKILRGK
jgi:ankyrin repeat protein